jgi:hypothetical protein
MVYSMKNLREATTTVTELTEVLQIRAVCGAMDVDSEH